MLACFELNLMLMPSRIVPRRTAYASVWLREKSAFVKLAVPGLDLPHEPATAVAPVKSAPLRDRPFILHWLKYAPRRTAPFRLVGKSHCLAVTSLSWLHFPEMKRANPRRSSSASTFDV